METKLYVIYDRTAERSSSICFGENHAVACRIYKEQIQKAGYRGYEAEIALYYIGDYDLKTCILTPMPIEDITPPLISAALSTKESLNG